MSITTTFSLAFNKSGISETFQASQTATMAVAGYRVQTPTIGTAVSAVSTANLSAVGYAYLRSLVTTTQATCTITFGRLVGGTLHPTVSLRPNENAAMRLAAGEYGVQAAAEGYRAQIVILEE